MRVEIWANCNIRKTHIRIRIKIKIKKLRIKKKKSICKDRIWVGPKIGLDFSPTSPNNEFGESK